MTTLGAAGLGASPATAHPESAPTSTRAERPLAGRTIVVDPGHQLGNSRFPRRINALVPDGSGGRKACNTTGTATNGGFPEATLNFRVARIVKRRLERLGATVVMTRTANSRRLWGPCVDVRGRLGNKGFRGRRTAADLKLSIHGDGNPGDERGFHVIVRPGRAAAMRYAKRTRGALERAGFPRSTYIGDGTALSIRSDLATLNWSRVPTVMVELGNMRNRADADLMTSSPGRADYARALVRGVVNHLGR